MSNFRSQLLDPMPSDIWNIDQSWGATVDGNVPKEHLGMPGFDEAVMEGSSDSGESARNGPALTARPA